MAAARMRDEIKNYYERNAELELKVADLEATVAALRKRLEDR